MNIRSL